MKTNKRLDALENASKIDLVGLFELMGWSSLDDLAQACISAHDAIYAPVPASTKHDNYAQEYKIEWLDYQEIYLLGEMNVGRC